MHFFNNPSFALGGNGRLDTGPTYFYTDDRAETLAREGRTDTSIDAARIDIVQPSIAVDRVAVAGIAAPYGTLGGPKADNDEDPKEWVRWMLAPGCFGAWLNAGGRARFCIGHDELIVLDDSDTSLRFFDTADALTFTASVDLRDLARVEESEPTAAHLNRGRGVPVSIMALFLSWEWDRQPGQTPTQVITKASIDHIALVSESAFAGTFCARR
jgi:hypothetical protein